LAALSGRQIHFRGCHRTPRLCRLAAALSLTLSLFLYSHLPTPSPRLSSRPKRPDLFFRGAFWRVGPRSGGIEASTDLYKYLFHFFTLLLCLIYLLYLLCLLYPAPGLSVQVFVRGTCLC